MTMNRNQYPCVEFDLDKLAANLAALVERCHDSLIEVAGVVKAVSSLPEIVRVYEESGVKFIATSRISQMRAIREAGICKKPLMLIRIPMLSALPDVVELCDISLQSDITVLRALNEEAKKQGADIREDGYAVLESTVWKEEDGKFYYDTGIQGEVLGEKVDSFAEISLLPDDCLLYNLGTMILERA